MKWILLLAIVVLFLGTCKLSEARANRRNQNGYKNSQRFQLIQKLTKARYDYYKQNTAKETIPFTNDEISQVLDMIQNNPISSSCLISEKCASDFMLNYNFILGKINERAAFLEFQFETNITEQNEQLMTDFAPISNRFQSLSKDVAFKFLQNSQNWDAELKRQLFLAAQGIVFKDPQDVTTLSKLSSKLESIYATAKVCRNKTNGEEECLELEPGLTSVMQNSRNYSELTWAWKGWHDASGKKMRSIFAQTVEIQNKAARDNNYTDLSDYWIDDFEDPNFESNAADLFAKIKPLYQQVHTYVRHKLDQVYGSNYPKWHDPNLIPAHLLGNMWAQGWDSIFDLVKPFPNVQETNLTEVLIDNGYTTLKMFKEAEKFFVSVNLFEMTPEFWAYSMLEKPKGRDVVCHASATDLYNGRDYRIKMCTVVNDETFSTVHHEMGHIEYYMAYKDQKTIFRTGANSAFHEAIGDTIALSVQTPKHFHAINMIKNASLSFEQDINYLMKMALKKVVFLPFGYLMDKWRWDVFRGRINTSNYNQRWWDMRKEYQGLEPPVPRSEDDFDPGAKYHIASYVPYARYFISHFLQFQFYRSLCKHANHTGPLHTCDFYQSENAGSHLRNMLSLGASKHWSYALKTLTLTETTVSADAILEYFKPLHDWLQEENRKFSNSKTMY